MNWIFQSYSSSSWEERLACKEEDADLSDPELLAEAEYAREHGGDDIKNHDSSVVLPHAVVANGAGKSIFYWLCAFS